MFASERGSDQAGRNRRTSLANLRDIKSKISLWEQTVKAPAEDAKLQKENAAPGRSLRDVAIEAFNRMPWSASKPPGKPKGQANQPGCGALPVGMLVHQQQNEPSVSVFQSLAVEAAALGKQKLDSACLHDEPDLASTPGRSHSSLREEEEGSGTPSSVAHTEWHDTCDIQEVLQECAKLNVQPPGETDRDASRRWSGNLQQRFAAEATPAATAQPAAARTPYSAFGVAPMDISPMLSAPGTPTEYTQFSELAPEFLLCSSNGLFSPCLDAAAASTGLDRGHLRHRLSVATSAVEVSPKLVNRFNTATEPSPSSGEQRPASVGAPGMSGEHKSVEETGGIGAPLSADLQSADECFKHVSSEADGSQALEGWVVEGGSPAEAPPGSEFEESPLWHPSFADEWKKLVNMTEPLPRFSHLPAVEETVGVDVDPDVDPDVREMIEVALRSAGHSGHTLSLPALFKVLGPVLQSLRDTARQAGDASERQATAAQELQATLDGLKSQLCNKEAQLTECRMALEHERGEKEHAEADAAAVKWGLENKLAKEKQRYAEQKEQFTILHRDKYMPLKDLSARLSEKVSQLEAEAKAADEAVRSKEREIEAKARQLKFKDVAVADAVKAAQEKAEALRQKEGAWRAAVERADALEVQLEDRQQEHETVLEQNAELESLAKGRLEELEKLSADRQKLYQLCDELLSEAERRQSAKA